MEGNETRQKPVPQAHQQMIGADLGSRLDREAVEIVLRVNEELETLRADLLESLPIRRLFDSVARDRGEASYDEWEQVAKDIICLQRDTDRIVTQARVSRDGPWGLYKIAISVRDRWVGWRRAEAHCAWEHRQKKDEENSADAFLAQFGLPELEQRLDHVIDGLRWLTSHTRATR